MQYSKIMRLVSVLSVLLFIGVLILYGMRDSHPDVVEMEQTVREILSEQEPVQHVDSECDDIDETPYVSPIDFESLQQGNSDIYGWLDIPGTDISYPLLQSQEDDTYYLTHDSSKKENKDGAIFTEHVYNSMDMQDPVTVVYGHHMKSGSMFGNLQELYSCEDGLNVYSEIVIYLPEEEIRYQVFASVPVNKQHILYYYDFTDADMYQLFLDRLFAIRSIDARFDDTVSISHEDKLLILSTCLKGNSKNRYLVLAKRI